MEHDGIFSGTFWRGRAFAASSGKTVTSWLIRLDEAVDVVGDALCASTLMHFTVFDERVSVELIGFSKQVGCNW